MWGALRLRAALRSPHMRGAHSGAGTTNKMAVGRRAPSWGRSRRIAFRPKGWARPRRTHRRSPAAPGSAPPPRSLSSPVKALSERSSSASSASAVGQQRRAATRGSSRPETGRLQAEGACLQQSSEPPRSTSCAGRSPHRRQSCFSQRRH